MDLMQALSIQLYSLRRFGTLGVQLDAVRDAGYRQVEIVQSHLDDAAITRRELDARGLAAPSGHVSLAALRENFAGTMDQARTLGIGRLYMPFLPEQERGGDGPQWRQIGRELGEMASRAHDLGLQLGYHNHDWELAAMEDGRPALAHFFEGADGTPLTWEIDVAWIVRGGGDPVAWLDAQRHRITAAHVKDIAPIGERLDEDGWTDVGSGTLDWPSLWRACEVHGATLMVVEHDNPTRPDAFARASFAYLSKLRS